MTAMVQKLHGNYQSPHKSIPGRSFFANHRQSVTENLKGALRDVSTSPMTTEGVLMSPPPPPRTVPPPEPEPTVDVGAQVSLAPPARSPSRHFSDVDAQVRFEERGLFSKQQVYDAPVIEDLVSR